MSDGRLRRTREAAQLLDRSRRLKPFGLVRHLLGVQAQVPSAAGLALAVRSDGLTQDAVDRAIQQDRSIVHTWAMRGTLHLVTAEDYGWLVPLVLGPRIANSLRRLRQLGLRGDQPERAAKAVERMLANHGSLTRREVLAGLRRRGFPTKDDAVAYHLVWLANSAGGVCYGPTRGRERCFVLFRDWADASKGMEPDAALRELVVRFLTSHGPSAPEDLALWSGIGMREIRRGWEAAADRLVQVQGPREPMWTVRSGRQPASGGLVRLLPNFDEYLLGWRDRAFVANAGPWKRINRGGGWLHPVVLVDGRAAGLWRAERSANAYRIHVEPFETLTPASRRAVGVEAERLGAFLGMQAQVDGGER